MKVDGLDIEYDDKTTDMKIGYDINGDGTPDITFKIKVKAVLKKYLKQEIVAVVLFALGAAHYLGFI